MEELIELEKNIYRIKRLFKTFSNAFEMCLDNDEKPYHLDEIIKLINTDVENLSIKFDEFTTKIIKY